MKNNNYYFGKQKLLSTIFYKKHIIILYNFLYQVNLL